MQRTSKFRYDDVTDFVDEKKEVPPGFRIFEIMEVITPRLPKEHPTERSRGFNVRQNHDNMLVFFGTTHTEVAGPNLSCPFLTPEDAIRAAVYKHEQDTIVERRKKKTRRVHVKEMKISICELDREMRHPYKVTVQLDVLQSQKSEAIMRACQQGDIKLNGQDVVDSHAKVVRLLFDSIRM